MSWETEMTTIVRNMIYDLDTPYTYSDSRLQDAILISAQLMLHNLTFPNTYTVDIPNSGLSPDPTSGTRDNAFINLASLKTACMIDTWGFRSKTGTAGILMKSGPDTIDTRGVLAGYQRLLDKGFCNAYEEAKWEYIAGNLTPGRAIIGPFVGENVDANYDGYDHRGNQFH